MISDWFASICTPLDPAVETEMMISCAIFATLLLTLIVLGFGPLRTWLGLQDKQRRSGGLSLDDGSLLAIWRLWRQLGRARSARTAFSAPEVPALIVPGAIETAAQGASPTCDLLSSLSIGTAGDQDSPTDTQVGAPSSR